MKVRTVMGLAVAVPGLVVALAAPGDAAARQVVTFAGEISVTPDGTARTLDVCFLTFDATCANGAESSGVAAGVSADLTAPAASDVVTGLQATAEYVEDCGPAGLAPMATATLRGKVHQRLSGWSPTTIEAQWTRVGLVAVVQGDARGVALVTPTGTAPCGQPVPVVIAGAVEIAE